MLLTHNNIEDCRTLAVSRNCQFICKLENNIPKTIYKRDRFEDYYLIDEFSGYLLKREHSLDIGDNLIITVNEFINLLPEFQYTG